MNISTKNWTGKSKTAARHDTIVYPYFKLFGKPVPENEQYWTFAGNCADNNGNLNEESEPVQMVECGLIKPEQFFGVDISESVIETNRKLLPRYNWFNGRLSQIAKKQKDFNPAIINIDHHKMIGRASSDLFSMISLLTTATKTGILVIFNVLTQNPYNGKADTDANIMTTLHRNRHFQNFIKEFRLFERGAYNYGGTGLGRKNFRTFIFYKK